VKRANRLMLIFGVILAAVSFVAVLAFGSLGQQPPAAPDPDVPVVVASQNLTLGTALTAEMLATVSRPPADAVDTYQHPEELIGKVVRRAVAQGAAISNDDFQSGSISVPDLVRSIQPGLRAIAVPLSRVDSVGALLQPGDFVDVIMSIDDLDGLNPIVITNPTTLQPGVDGGASSPYIPFISIDDFVNNTTVKTVVQNVQVLATLPKQVAEPTNVVAPSDVVEPDLIAILAVYPQQVEIIRFAQLDGHISLSLRSPSDYPTGAVDTTGITLKVLVEQYGVLPPLPVVTP
jgi:Flp pilus assembly protein CpaB